MKKLTLLLFFLAALSFSHAQSQDSSNDSISNYNTLILKFGANLVDSSGERNPFNFISDFDEMAFSNNFNAELEYRFSRRFILAAVLSTNKWKKDTGNIDSEIISEDFEYTAIDLDFKYYFSEDLSWIKRVDWLELYLHAGLGGFIVDKSNVSFNGGLGSNFWFTDNFGLNLSGTAKWASNHSENRYNTNHFQYSASLTYRFTDNDFDNDGVKNKLDDCPNVSGSPLNNGCPEENLDRDGDGVTDSIDNCPDVYGTDYGCPLKEIEVDMDTDGDSVFDSADACPKIVGLPSNNGCPLPDKDNDGIVDAADACPSIPGIDSNNGCPFEANELMDLLSKHIYFSVGGYDFSQDSNATLTKIIEFVKQYPQARFKISGHADSYGPEELNMALSQNRVNAVRDYLINNGVASNSLTISAFGESMPLVTNSTREGRSLNRRVEIVMARN
ncbi:MAG: OmpA family protein [Flavobacteriaceae bacterium]